MAQTPPGIFGRLAGAVMDRPRIFTALIVALLLGAIGFASRLHVNPNILELLPPGDPTTQAIQALNDEEGGANLLTIAVRGDDEDALDAFMLELSGRLRQMDTIQYALYEVDEDLAWRLGLMQLNADELRTIRDRLRGALAMGPAASNPFVAGRLLDLGPLTEKLRGGQKLALMSHDGGVARVLVRPKGSAYQPQFARPLMADVRALLAELAPEDRGLEVIWIGGAYRHSVEDLEGILYDLRWTAIVSASMVVLLVGVAFRDPRAIFLIFVPLMVGTIWTAGWVGLAVGTLNTFTSIFAAVLIGLGVDFCIHLYSRYREERAHGGALRDAVVRAWDKAGPPSATAALTSAGGFGALWAAGFQGFSQLGTILAGGVLLCFLAALVTLPLLILWRERAPHALPLRRLRVRDRVDPPTYRLAPLGLVITVLVTIAAAAQIPNVGFQYDLSELRRRGLAFADLDDDEKAMAQDSYAPVVVSYPDAESLAADHTRLDDAVKAGKIEEIGRVLSLHTVLPVDQETRLGLLAEVGALARSPNLIYLPPSVQENLKRIAQTSPEPLTADQLPYGLQHVLGAADGHHRMLLVPAGNMWDLRNNVKLHEAVERWVPDRPAAGEFLATAVLYRLVKADAPRVAGVALLTIFLLSLIDLRNVARAVGAVAALVVGLCWAGAGLALFRVDLSMVNFVGIPILIGIGVDVVIHLLHRLDEEGPGRVRWALATTGWAAGLSSATTVLAFSALAVASSQGVRSLGLLIVLGLTLVTAAAFVVVPLGWQTAWKIRGQLPQVWPPEDRDRESDADGTGAEDGVSG